MLTGEIRSQIDQIWNAFWSGGISNPLEVIEQITYLLFLKRLDEQEIAEELKAYREKKPMGKRFFPEGKDSKKRPYQDYRWNRFKNTDPRDMYAVVSEHIFPWLRTLGGNGTTYSKHMEGARFTIPTPALLAKVVDMIDKVPMEDRDTKGDLYEYMLGKIASAGQNGQFRTPRQIIRLMVEMVEPKPTDIVCDPACGTCGFLVAVGESLRERHPGVLTNAKLRQHFHRDLFHGFDFDNTMLRIGSMNMLLHGVENPDITYRDSLAQDHAGEEEKYTLVLANPPFAGSLDYESCAKDLQQVVKTRKTELLFLALFIRLLKPGGRAAVIVPDGVLFGSSNAHKSLRKMLIEDQKLDAVISLPGGVFKPYAGVSTAILLFTKTNSGGTDQVWFYDVEADGMSLDDKRIPLLSEDKLGAMPKTALTADEHAKNNLPDILARWRKRDGSERKRPRTAQSFYVPKADLVAQGYDLSLNRYKEVVHEQVGGALEEKASIPMVRAELELIIEVQTEEFWQDITTVILEDVRKRLRSLVKFIEKTKRQNIYTDFTDLMGEETEIALPGLAAGHDIERFRDKTQQFLKAHEDDPVIHKLRWNEALSSADLDVLEKILVEAGAGTLEDMSKVRAGSGLGLFVREMIGLDREAAKRAFDGFLAGKTLTANQIQFINLVIDYLTQSGWMRASQLYESPFTDYSPRGVEGMFDSTQVTQLLSVLDSIRQKAAV